ncbi:MAG: hypothetical protein GY870_03155, partial [archaeon]|nr:hypothetical protein [archaeon]
MERLKPLFTLKNTCVVLLLMNIASIVLGISYLAIQSYNIIWDLFGIILLGSLFGNIILIHNTWKKINNNSKIGNRINLLFYGYLVFSVFAMPLMFLCNFLISNSYSNEISDNIVMVSIVYISYFGLLLIGIGIIYLILSNIDNIGLWSSENKTEREEKSKTRIVKKVLRIILEFFTYIGIIGSVIFAYVTVNGIYGGFIFGIFVAMMGIFFGFVFLSTTVLLLKLTNLRKKKNLFKSLALVGFFSSLICMFPYFSSPLYIYDAELNFSEAFGENWRDNIDASAEVYFMKTQFSLPGYFLGIQGPSCIIEKDIEFYNETSGPNAGFKLHFDAYMPLNNGKDSSGNWLPGHNSTIIRVHGGAWVLGDKGAGNMMQMNKYLAAQGYIVFDIQYGLYNGSFTIPIITPEYKLGNFTMNEIVNHTGEFTKYLGIHADEYGANLDSVFISGGSAGGQLT